MDKRKGIIYLSCMSKDLKRNIYALEYPGFPISDVKLRSPEPLKPIRYACENRVNHLGEISQNRVDLSDNSAVHGFIKEHFLHWLEALSLMKSISIGVTATAKLASLVTVSFLFLQESPHRC